MNSMQGDASLSDSLTSLWRFVSLTNFTTFYGKNYW